MLKHSLWKILLAYGIPYHLAGIIKSFYDNFTCGVCDSDILFEVSDRGVSCPHCVSTLLCTGSWGAPLRITSGALDGHLKSIMKYLFEISRIPPPGGGGWRWVLPCMVYIGMCGPKGHVFSAVLVNTYLDILLTNKVSGHN